MNNVLILNITSKTICIFFLLSRLRYWGLPSTSTYYTACQSIAKLKKDFRPRQQQSILGYWKPITSFCNRHEENLLLLPSALFGVTRILTSASMDSYNLFSLISPVWLIRTIFITISINFSNITEKHILNSMCVEEKI